MFYLFDMFEWFGPFRWPLLAAQIAFTIWMLTEISRRPTDQYWLWIVLFFQPVGPWLYFFLVRSRSVGFSVPGLRLSGASWPARAASLDELLHRVQRSPTVANRLELSHALMAKSRHAEAAPHLEEILKSEPQYCLALHALAECRIETGPADEAVNLLKKILEREPRWSSYRAWKTLVRAHDVLQRPGEALEACRTLDRYAPTLETKCELAERLIAVEKADEAARLLDSALADHRFSSFGKKLREWRWSRRATALKREAEEKSRGV